MAKLLFGLSFLLSCFCLAEQESTLKMLSTGNDGNSMYESLLNQGAEEIITLDGNRFLDKGNTGCIKFKDSQDAQCVTTSRAWPKAPIGLHDGKEHVNPCNLNPAPSWCE